MHWFLTAVEHLCPCRDVCLLWLQGVENTYAMEKLGHTTPNSAIPDERGIRGDGHEDDVGGSVWKQMCGPDHHVGQPGI